MSRLRTEDGEGGGSLRIVPFVPGRRPTDEARSQGMGSSDRAALVLGDASRDNFAYVLFSLSEHRPVQATLTFTGHDGTAPPETVPGWDRRPVELVCFEEDGDGALRPARAEDRHFVLALSPERDLCPGPYGFEHLFMQRLQVELHLEDGSAACTPLDVCDVRQLGCLYTRLVEKLIGPDTKRQAAKCGREDPGHIYHPWFPVLQIGGDKAALYTRALVDDIVHKQRYLADPAWLLRVGLYLELLTCLGVAEAVRDEVGDLLTPEERAAFESERYAPVRTRLDPAAWKRVWALRSIAFPRRGMPRAGPVSLMNLMNKKRATLQFLHAHHEDLKQAIELAGPNHATGQETWQRVFRDAERAVLRQTTTAFPELGYLPEAARELVLWHQKGNLEIAPVRVPRAVAVLMGDQDGLFAAACHEYRASMNHVASWAAQHSLMNPTGQECITRRVSLLEAHMDTPERVAALQRRDGYTEELEVGEAAPATVPPLEDAEKMLGSVPIFGPLEPEQLRDLARRARPLALGPTERFVVQGAAGTSLFVVADGEVEIVLQRPGEPDMVVDTLGRGEVVGEMSLLTGEPRSATVRAADSALVYEIGWRQYAPLLDAHPEWIETLAELMEERLQERNAALSAYEQRQEIRHRILARLRGGADRARPAAARAE